MPEAQEDHGSRTRVAVIVLGSLVLGGLLAVLAGKLQTSKFMTTAYFASSGGLKAGASVNLNGVTIGTVKSVSIPTSPLHGKTPVQVVMMLERAHEADLHTDSTATIVGLGALGDTAVDIDSRSAVGPQLRDGNELKAMANPSVVDAKTFQTTANNLNLLVGRFNGVVDQMETGNGSIGQLLSNPGLTNEAKGTVSKAQLLAKKLKGNSNTVGQFINEPGVTTRIANISKNVQGVSESMAKLTGGPLRDNLAETSAHLDSLEADVNQAKGGVGLLMTDSTAKRDLAGATTQANALNAGLSAGKGTAGKLVAGGQVNVDLTRLQAQISTLTTMIRQNPTRYLTIQVRVF